MSVKSFLKKEYAYKLLFVAVLLILEKHLGMPVILFALTGTWATANGLTTARSHDSPAGTQTAGLAASGYDGSNNLASTEEYDGTNWSAGGDVGTARRGLGGAGTQTAALCFSGYSTDYTKLTEEYDGTSWSAGGDLPNTDAELGGAGTQTAALSFGGKNNPTTSQKYDGTAWSADATLVTGERYLWGTFIGTQDAALCTVGSPFQEYNGTSWYNGGNPVSSRSQHAGFGEQNAAVVAGGIVDSAKTATTEQYNGTNSETSGDLNTARYWLSGAGSLTAGLSFSGYDGSNYLATTEEYTGVNDLPYNSVFFGTNF